MGYATHLVTPAHRVSSIHGRYQHIHEASMAFSLRRVVAKLAGKQDSEFCGYLHQLVDLEEELTQVSEQLHDGSAVQPTTTLGDEFILAMEEYVAALRQTLQCLGRICDGMCREQSGAGVYGEVQSRADRKAYDASIQHYRHLGDRLLRLYQRL